MSDKKIISQLISIGVSVAFIALFIILLPYILVVAAAILLLLVVAAMVIRYKLGKDNIFIYRSKSKQSWTPQQDPEHVPERHELKDVTNSIKNKKEED